MSVWDDLLAAAQAVHGLHRAVRDFVPEPDDIAAQGMEAFHIPPADLMTAQVWGDTPHAALRDAFVAAGRAAQWRETYKDTEIGQDFMDRFGCYCLIGPGGAFTSAQVQSYVVYMPPGLHYPWHHHPAEEMCLVVAGQAEFLRKGEGTQVLGPGSTSFHASRQPHAMRTTGQPVMAYVLWRNHFETPPVLTEIEVHEA